MIINTYSNTNHCPSLKSTNGPLLPKPNHELATGCELHSLMSVPGPENVSLIFHLQMHSQLINLFKKKFINFLPYPAVFQLVILEVIIQGSQFSLKNTGQRQRDTLMVQFRSSQDTITQRHRGERQEKNQYIISAFQKVFPSTKSMSQFTSVS